MRSVRFRDDGGHIREGIWKNGTIEFCGRVYDSGEVEIVPPSNPSKIIVTGFNYEGLIDRLGVKTPNRPRLFFKTPNTITSHDKIAEIPAGLSAVYEGEIGVIIGKQCRNVKVGEEKKYIAGFTCVDDISIGEELEDDPGAVRKSGFDTATPIGPVMASIDLVPECPNMEIKINGKVERSTDFSGQLFSMGEILAEITKYITLEPGDIFTTGTPVEPGLVSDGDIVEIYIEGIETLRHGIRLAK